ncbi:MAG TPA: hypothetical protein VEJ87_12345, partial [Acidimicrobiales bacterium]|nr:hypothetical protein [Acidimicrobiales bacterium]
MPGMNTGINTNDPSVVSSFQAALLHQFLVVLVVLALIAISWSVLRSLQLRRAVEGGGLPLRPDLVSPEPAARRLLRISFGLIWIFDGILQGQSSMPLGLVPQAIQPTASSSPDWVQQVVEFGAKVWDYHPVPAATAAVWIQVGIGLWLLVARSGTWSRLAGLVSAGWGLV